MKVLFLQKIVAVSGAEQYYLQLLPELQSNGVNCAFMCLVPKKEYLDENLASFVTQLESHGVDVHFVRVPNKFISISSIRKLAVFIRKEEFDIVQSNLIFADVIMALVKVFGRVKSKLISTYHSFDSSGYQKLYGFNIVKHRNLFYYLSVISQYFFDHTIVISDGLKELLLGKRIQKKDKLTRIHYGFKFKDRRVSKNEIFRKSSNQIVMVGRLVPVKMHLAIISILKSIASKVDDISLVIVGDGPLRKELESAVKAYGVEDIVFFEGFRKDVHNYFGNSDLSLVLSKAEGFGVVILEAFQYDCPVLAWDEPAMNEIIIDQESGILVESFDLKKLEISIEKYFAQRSEYKKLFKDKARARLETYFSTERMTIETISLYKLLLD